MDSSDADMVAVIATSLRETGESDPNGLQFTAAEADCAAEKIADAVERPRLEELGLGVDSGVGPELSEPPLTTSEGDAVFAAYEACLDLPAQVTTLLKSGGSMTDDVAECVADAYVESGIMREALLNPQFNQEVNDRIDAVLAEAEAECSS